MELTDGQKTALNSINKWLSKRDDYLYVLSGNAGTGKTTITKRIIKEARKKCITTLCVAPTHKARKVIDSIVNQSSFIYTPTCTVAGLLGKQKKLSYIGTKNYGTVSSNKIGDYELVIIDEVSMISIKDFEAICSLAESYKVKVLFIGDEAQIPSPSPIYVKKGDYIEKAQSPAFKLKNHSRLTDIIRTKGENPIIPVYDHMRKNIGTGFTVRGIKDENPGNGYFIYRSADEMISVMEQSKYLSQFRLNECKIITYTNKGVNSYNKIIRSSMDYKNIIEEGEVLMGYTNVGLPTSPLIENGADYIVEEIDYDKNRTIVSGELEFRACGHVIRLDTNEKLFLPDTSEEMNDPVMKRLVELAEKVNMKKSTKKDYSEYRELKDQLIFIEDLYKVNKRVMTLKEVSSEHPLLMRSTKDSIEDPDKVNKMYPGLIEKRMADNKELVPNERLIDIFQVLEKDLDYGYAITAHKSQGSTYKTVFIDERSFHVLQDGWSKKYKCMISRKKERDQLKYVSVTRASNEIHILASEPFDVDH